MTLAHNADSTQLRVWNAVLQRDPFQRMNDISGPTESGARSKLSLRTKYIPPMSPKANFGPDNSISYYVVMSYYDSRAGANGDSLLHLVVLFSTGFLTNLCSP